MCRHLGYIGPCTSVAGVLTGGATSLLTQSWAPREMRGGGTVNADGFGAAWWTPDGARSYRSDMPMWTDPAVNDVLAQIDSVAVMGAVRSATVGMPVVRTACAPFVDGQWAFSHNGVVRGWPESVADLASDVPIADLLRAPAPTDSATVWTILRHRLRTEKPAGALQSLVTEIDLAAPDSRLNMLLSDGETVWATALYHSLWTLAGGESVVVSSEPLDDRDGWTAVPDRSFVTARVGAVDVRPL